MRDELALCTAQHRSRAKGELVEGPADGHAARVETTVELLIHLLTNIDVILLAAHTLVSDHGRSGLAVGIDSNRLAAHGVPVGLSTHQEVGQSNNVVAVVFAAVILATSTHADGVVGEVTIVFTGARAARATAFAAFVAAWHRRRSNRCRRSSGRGLGLEGRWRGRRRRSDVNRAGGGGGRRGRGRRRSHEGRRGRCRRRWWRRSRLGRGLLNSRRVSLEEVARGLHGQSSWGGRSFLTRSDPEGGGGINNLGDIFNLRHPLSPGDDIAGNNIANGVETLVVSVVRLGSGHSNKGGRSGTRVLHDGAWENTSWYDYFFLMCGAPNGSLFGISNECVSSK